MADWAYRGFYLAVVLGAGLALAGPVAFGQTQSAVEQGVMLIMLPLFLFAAYALRKPQENQDETGTVDH